MLGLTADVFEGLSEEQALEGASGVLIRGRFLFNLHPQTLMLFVEDPFGYCHPAPRLSFMRAFRSSRSQRRTCFVTRVPVLHNCKEACISCA